ncbi:MAG: hypothetical protein QGG90_01805, partial [Nitrospinota bacterium]|nr:hypothetical protein [Nitrospinota bacterium]
MWKKPAAGRSPCSPWEKNRKGRPIIELLIVAGEASGDALGGRLAAALRARLPDLRLSGVGGPDMRAAGVETWSGVEDLEVVGIVEVARRLPALFRIEARILREVRTRNIRAAILIDYPGFNLRLAGRLHARGVKTVQFVAPQLWAWGRWRAGRMARSLDRLLVILPFEPEFFGRLGIRAEFVGNPIADALAAAFAPGPAAPPGRPAPGRHRTPPGGPEAARPENRPGRSGGGNPPGEPGGRGVRPPPPHAGRGPDPPGVPSPRALPSARRGHPGLG